MKLILAANSALFILTFALRAADPTTVQLEFTLRCSTTVHVDAIGFTPAAPTANLDSVPIIPVRQISDGHRFQVPVTNNHARRISVTGTAVPGVNPRVELALSKAITSGITLISNPFEASDKRVAAQFANAPNGTQIHVFENGALQISSKGLLGWINGDLQLSAGQGAFITIPHDAQGNDITYTIQFRGTPSTRDPRDGTTIGFNLLGNTQPCDLVPILTAGEQIYRWNGSNYNHYSLGFLGWIPEQPTIPAGEAVWANLLTVGGTGPGWHQ